MKFRYVTIVGDFGWAIQAMKHGEKVCRRGWNGKNMYLILMDGYESVEANRMTREKHGLKEGSLVTIMPYIAMKTAQDTIQGGWLASQADILSEDWEIA